MVTAEPLHIQTMPFGQMCQKLGLDPKSSAEQIVSQLASIGCHVVPFPIDGSFLDEEEQVALMVMTQDQEPIAPPRATLMRVLATLEHGFLVAHATGPASKERKRGILLIIDAIDQLTRTERAVVATHFLHYESYGMQKARPIDFSNTSEVVALRIIRALYGIATAEGALYDVHLEAIENALAIAPPHVMVLASSMIEVHRKVLPFARKEPDPSTWTNLPEREARLLSWLSVRPRLTRKEAEIKARSLGMDLESGIERINGWAIESFGMPMIGTDYRITGDLPVQLAPLCLSQTKSHLEPASDLSH